MARMRRPTRDEVEEYAREKGYAGFDAEAFMAHYESNGWMVGRVPMKSWQAAVVNWQKMRPQFQRSRGERMPINQRNKRINELNQRKARLLRLPRTAAIERELTQIQTELHRL